MTHHPFKINKLGLKMVQKLRRMKRFRVKNIEIHQTGTCNPRGYWGLIAIVSAEHAA